MDLGATALRTAIRSAALDVLIDLASPLAEPPLPPQTLADRRAGADVDLLTLVVRVGALVDLVELGAEELVLPETVRSLLPNVFGRCDAWSPLRRRRAVVARGKNKLRDPAQRQAILLVVDQ
jgi:hypothetical protein